MRIFNRLKVIAPVIITGFMLTANAYAADLEITMDVIKQSDAEDITGSITREIQLPKADIEMVRKHSGMQWKKGNSTQADKVDNYRYSHQGHNHMQNSMENSYQETHDAVNDVMEDSYQARTDSHKMCNDMNSTHQMNDNMNNNMTDNHQMDDNMNNSMTDNHQMDDNMSNTMMDSHQSHNDINGVCKYGQHNDS